MNAKQLWQAALGDLQMKVPGPSFQTWLKNTSIAQFDEGKLVAIAVPSNFAKEWLEKRYCKEIAETLKSILGYEVEVRFEVRTPARGESQRTLHALDGVGEKQEMEMPIAVGQQVGGSISPKVGGQPGQPGHVGHGDPTPISIHGQIGAQGQATGQMAASGPANVIRPAAPGSAGMARGGTSGSPGQAPTL